MKKVILFIFIIFVVKRACCQVMINPPSFPLGILTKNQLWNLVITNSSNKQLTGKIQLVLNDAFSGKPIMNAVSGKIIINRSSNLLSAHDIAPIIYNSLNINYNLDPDPNAFLPPGNFRLCYTLLLINGDNISNTTEQCIDVLVTPASPVILSQPIDNDLIKNGQAVFTWIPPTPINQLSNLLYDFNLKKLLPGQSTTEAINNNPEVLSVKNINGLTYNSSSLVSTDSKQQQYVWQVVAKNGGNEISRSDIWKFTMGSGNPINSADYPYIKFTKSTDISTAIFFSKIKFEYLNESSDSVWRILVQDLTSPQHAPFILPINQPALKTGSNLVEYDASTDFNFINDHIYLFKLVNSRAELWQLRFQYKYSNQNNGAK